MVHAPSAARDILIGSGLHTWTAQDIVGEIILGAFVVTWIVLVRQAKRAGKTKQAKTVETMTCPACRNLSVRPLAGVERVASGVAGGLLFSRKARAHFQCSSCGYTW
jgi:hypothetical protein